MLAILLAIKFNFFMFSLESSLKTLMCQDCSMLDLVKVAFVGHRNLLLFKLSSCF